MGTIDAFYDAHMDLVSVHPVFNLYNSLWPIRTQQDNLPPAKFVNGGMSQESMVGSGTIVSAATPAWARWANEMLSSGASGLRSRQ